MSSNAIQRAVPETVGSLCFDSANQRIIKIAFLDHTAVLGGGEIALFHLVSKLDRSRFEPVVVLFSDGPLGAKLASAYVETHVVKLSEDISNIRKDMLSFSSVLHLRNLLRATGFCWRLSRWLKHNKIDVVYCNSLKSDVMGGLSAALSRKKSVWHVRDRIVSDYLPQNVARLFRMLCRVVPARVVVNSASTKLDLNLSRAIVVHDGTPIPNVSEVESGERSILRVGMIGRIAPWKGQDVFIRAICLVHSQFPQARFVIVGAPLFSEDAYDSSIRRLVRELHLEKVIEFTGFRNDVGDILKELDLVVHASTTGEPFGQVIIEAMAAGKAVIATNGGGVPEIVTPDCGLLVPMNDVAAMADAMYQLLADDKRRRQMGRLGRQRVVEHFSIDRTATKVMAVVEEMFKRHPLR